MPLRNTLLRTVAANSPSLIEFRDRVLVAVSGGPDSLSLIHALHHLREELQLGDVIAAHLDHGLRGAESRADSEFVAAFCAELGIPCRVGSVDVAALRADTHGSTQSVARAARYAFLDAIAAEVGANKIATAHTRDDRIETVLLNILRGTGPDGLKGIPIRRGKYIRPLLDTSRADVVAYCSEHGLTPRQDPSNTSPNHYTRNRIRLELLPTLERDYAPGVRGALLRLSQIAEADQDYIHMEAERALARATIPSDSPVCLTLDRALLAALHHALMRYTLRAAIDKVRGTLDGITFTHIDQIATAVLDEQSPPFGITTPHPACVITIDRRHVHITPFAPSAAALSPFCLPLSVPGEAQIDAIGTLIRAQLDSPRTPYNDTIGISVALDSDQVDIQSLVVRNWLPGDKIDPLGMHGKTKKIQDIFTDAKVPRAGRPLIPIVADKHGPLWIVGYTVSERARTTAATRRALVLIAISN